jgi:hypothetical protein
LFDLSVRVRWANVQCCEGGGDEYR